MTRQKRLGSLAALPVTILMCSAAMAQSPSASPMSGSSDMGSSAGGGSATMGAVDSSTTTSTTTTETFDSGAAPAIDDASTTLPNTGGEPLMIAMLGSMAAMGAFALRRKLS